MNVLTDKRNNSRKEHEMECRGVILVDVFSAMYEVVQWQLVINFRRICRVVSDVESALKGAV